MTDNREIQVTDIKGISIGHASNQDAGTGVTVLYFPMVQRQAVTSAAAVLRPEKHH